MASYYPTQSNYTYDVASMRNSFYSDFSNYHGERLCEKTFKAFYLKGMVKATFTTIHFNLFTHLW